MGFCGFVVFIIFALAFAEIGDNVSSIIEKAEGETSSAACQAKFISESYTLDIFATYDNDRFTEFGSAGHLGSSTCQVSSYAGFSSLQRTEKSGSNPTSATNSPSTGTNTNEFGCPGYNAGGKMRDLMYHLIGKIEA